MLSNPIYLHYSHLKREMKAGMNLRHPNIVKFIGFAIECDSYGPTATLVSEWCKHGNVVQYLEWDPLVDHGMLVSHSHSCHVHVSTV